MYEPMYRRLFDVAAATLTAVAMLLLAGDATADPPRRWPLVAALVMVAGASVVLVTGRRSERAAATRERDRLTGALGEAQRRLQDEREANTAAREDALRQVEGARADAQRQVEAARADARRHVEAERVEAQRRIEAASAGRERAEQERRALRDALSRHRDAIARLQRSWQAERAWSRELRGQLHDALSSGRRADGDREDVHALVLRAAIQLVGAEKGLLLSRHDADDDGELDLVVARGFEQDPQRSAVAQRFARTVLQRDEIIREDQPAAPAAERTPADDEIDALVATPLFLRDRFEGVVICANRPGGFEEIDDDVLLALGDHAGAALHHGRLHRELGEAHRAVIRALLEAIAARRPDLQRESAELAVRAVTLARHLDLDAHGRDVLVMATLLRAVGELGLPDRVLLNSAPLDDEERALLEVHPRIAFSILGQVPALRDIAVAVLYHHERFDGDGYPAGLAGDEIPLPARALAVLEAYGAMTHDRPHRPAESPQTACAELVAAAGRQLDPEVVALFVEDVRTGRGAPRPELADAILEALPIVPDVGASDDLEPLAAASTDGLTLLGNHRALQQALIAAVRDARLDRPFALVLVQLEDVARLNAEEGQAAGDRAIQLAARAMQRAAVRLGGRAYRVSGRRLAVLAPLRDRDAEALRADVDAELTGGPHVQTAAAAWEPGSRGEELLERARRALLQPSA